MLGLALALAASAASAQAPQPLIPAFFTGERLLEICRGEHSGQCWMYVAGVLDGVFMAETGSDQRSICGGQLTNREAAQRVTDFLERNPDMREKAAAVAVKMAIESELTCPKPDEIADKSL